MRLCTFKIRLQCSNTQKEKGNNENILPFLPLGVCKLQVMSFFLKNKYLKLFGYKSPLPFLFIYFFMKYSPLWAPVVWGTQDVLLLLFFLTYKIIGYLFSNDLRKQAVLGYLYWLKKTNSIWYILIIHHKLSIFMDCHTRAMATQAWQLMWCQEESSK